MAVNTVTGTVLKTNALAPRGGAVTVVQSPSGTTGDTTFVIEFQQIKYGSLRGRTLLIANVGTAFGAITSFESSLDGVSYEPLKTVQPGTISANTVDATVAVHAVTTLASTHLVIAHDFRFLRIVTTGGAADSAFTVSIGS